MVRSTFINYSSFMGNRYPEAVKHLEADFGVTEEMSNLIYPGDRKLSGTAGNGKFYNIN